MTFKQFCIAASSLFGATGVMGGAFGAHALSRLPPERLATLKTGGMLLIVGWISLLFHRS